MKLISWVIGASVVSSAVVTAVAGAEFAGEIVAGMAGPLAMVAGSWMLAEWTYRRNPAGMTALMMAAFAVKMIVFGVYVAVMLKGVGLRPAPFAASFTGYFVALYFVQALALRRLTAGGPADRASLT
jgi:hypothetical protein